MVLRGIENPPRGPARCTPSPDGIYSTTLCHVNRHRIAVGPIPFLSFLHHHFTMHLRVGRNSRLQPRFCPMREGGSYGISL